jgi:predicted XRE-type DNA-binding protein
MSKLPGHAIARWFVKGSHDIEMTTNTKSRRRTRAGANVFLDLGFPPREAKRLLAHADAQIDESIRLKQQLMDEIAEWMKEANVTQAVAAEVLRVTRPRVSDVVNHKVEKFTIDALVSMLARIGKQVRLAVQ